MPANHYGKKMTSIRLSIEGMHCTGCARTIELLLGAEPGVREAQVSFESATARVLYDPAATNAQALGAAIEKAGYRASHRE